MLTPTHRVAKCAAVAAMKEYKNPHQASGAGDGRGNASGVQVSDGRARLVQHGACTGASDGVGLCGRVLMGVVMVLAGEGERAARRASCDEAHLCGEGAAEPVPSPPCARPGPTSASAFEGGRVL